MICKLKARLNLHGILNVESGYYVEDMEVEEPIPEEKEGEKKDGEKKDPDVCHDPVVTPQPSSEDEHTTKRPRLNETVLTTEKAMETDEKPKTRKVKKQVRKGDLPIISGTASLEDSAKTAAAEQEASMIMEDKLVADTEDKKNELETYIYDLRNKIDDQYSDFASEDEKTKLKAKLAS